MGQTWNGDLVHDAGNVASDVVGWFSGPPGDPGRIRHVASQIEALADHFDGHRRGLNEAVDELTGSWQGAGATQFHETWYGGGGSPAPATVLTNAHVQLTGFVTGLRDYADKLEQAQNEHWIQMGIMAALTVVNAAQLGADPATDAAEVGVAATTEVAAGFSLAGVATLAIDGAFTGLSSDVIAQLGADVLDHLDPQFDRTGDHVTSWFNPQEAVVSGLEGGAGGLLLGTAGLLFRDGAPPAIAGDAPAITSDTPAAAGPPKVFDASDIGTPVPSRLKPTTDTAPNISDVNTDTAPQPNNCSACTKAVDARMTGDSQASAGHMDTGISLQTAEQEWGGTLDTKAWPEIQQDLTDAGNGARGVMTLQAPGGGHIVNVVNDNGTIRIVDGQVGQSYSAMSDYVRGTIFQGPTTVTRFLLLTPSTP